MTFLHSCTEAKETLSSASGKSNATFQSMYSKLRNLWDVYVPINFGKGGKLFKKCQTHQNVI